MRGIGQKLRVALITRIAMLNQSGYTLLESPIDFPIIVPRPIDVQVQVLMDDLDVPTRHLHHWQTNHLVIRRTEPLPIRELQIFLLDLSVQIDPKRPKM